MNISGQNTPHGAPRKTNQNIQVYVRVRPLNGRERCIRSNEIIEVVPPREIVARHVLESKLCKKFTFDRTFGPESKQVDVYSSVVGPLIEEVLSGYNCTVFAYGQTGTGKTHTMVGNECAELKASWDDNSEIGIIPRALCHLFDELRLMKMEFSMRISYLELYNEELFDLLSTDDTTKIRIFDDSAKKGSVIIQGLEEIPVHSKDDVYKLLEKGKERRRTASTLMNAQSSRSHTVFSILVHIKENGIDGEEMLKIGKLNLVDLAGSENVTKAGNEKGVRVRETVNINQSLLTLGRVITALVERTPHIPYRESKLTRLLQESLGGRTKTSIIATISPGHKDIEETLSTLEYAHRAKHIQNKPEINQKLTKKTVLKEYTEEIDKLKRELMATRDKNGIYIPEEAYNEMQHKMDSQHRELNEKVHLLKALKDELMSKEKIFNEVSLNLVEKTTELKKAEYYLKSTKGALLETKKVLNSTKRRYREKKVLLESHAKTEETLTTQATQILEVAEVATKDTEALLDTIDRRKDVDVKIQTACERFSERMNDNFEMMDDNLKTLTEKQHSLVYNIKEELANTSNVQLKLLENSTKQLKDLHEFWDKYQSTASTIEECSTISLTKLNDEHKGANDNFLAELKANEHKFKEQIKESILALESSNAQQKIALDSMRDNVKEKLQENNTKLQQHTNRLQIEMDAIKQKSLENVQELQEITKNLGVQRCLIEEEQKCMEEFQRKLLEFQEKRYACNDRITQNVENLEKAQQFTITQLEGSSKLKQDFLHQNNLAVENNCQMVDNLMGDVELSIDVNVAKCSTLHVQLENKAQESSIHIQNKTEDDQGHHSQINEKIKQFGTDIKRVRLENNDSLHSKTSGIAQSLEEQMKRSRNHLAVVKGLNSTVGSSVTDYAKIYKEQMTVCVNDVENFRKSELKTYTATGATPSKKEFKYPKVLVATSPHTAIVKRFRQEMDWSDLDTTVAIDEESENENETGVDNSLQSISDAETLLNSTPIDTEVMPPKKSNVTYRSSNSLRLPQNGSANSSSSSRNNSSPRKDSYLSRTSSPSYKKENKENIA